MSAIHRHGGSDAGATPSSVGDTGLAVNGRPLRILLMTDRVDDMTNGHGIRVAAMIDALRSIADVRAVLIDSSAHGAHWGELGIPASVVRAANPRWWSKPLRFAQLLPNNLRYRARRRLQAQLATTIGDRHFDVVWCSSARVHLLTADVARGRRVVDFYDLNHLLLTSKISDRTQRRGAIRAIPRNVRDWIDARLWRRLHVRIAGEVSQVTVCSVEDLRNLERLGVGNCTIIPNGYPDPGSHAPRLVTTPRRLLLVGTLKYEPNLLAATWMVDEVLPRIRAVCPDVELVVVGDSNGVPLHRLASRNVTFTGLVPDVAPYYAAASVAVVPLHSGGGTRLKVIEALARRVPLVATTLGSLGHDLEPGKHLLVADDADGFAAACVDVLTDPSLGRDLVEAGFACYDARLTSRCTIDAVRAVVIAVSGDDRLTPTFNLSRAGSAGDPR